MTFKLNAKQMEIKKIVINNFEYKNHI